MLISAKDMIEQHHEVMAKALEESFREQGAKEVRFIHYDKKEAAWVFRGLYGDNDEIAFRVYTYNFSISYMLKSWTEGKHTDAWFSISKTIDQLINSARLSQVALEFKVKAYMRNLEIRCDVLERSLLEQEENGPKFLADLTRENLRAVKEIVGEMKSILCLEK